MQFTLRNTAPNGDIFHENEKSDFYGQLHSLIPKIHHLGFHSFWRMLKTMTSTTEIMYHLKWETAIFKMAAILKNGHLQCFLLIYPIFRGILFRDEAQTSANE